MGKPQSKGRAWGGADSVSARALGKSGGGRRGREKSLRSATPGRDHAWASLRQGLALFLLLSEDRLPLHT